MRRTCIAILLTTVAGASSAQTPRTHRLEATPETVAYGYYWSEAKPVVRIASGDILDVDTLITNSPNGLQRAGVPPEKIQASLKTIVAEVTGERRGPGGHILTGPVFVEGAEPGDVLEVKVLSIDLPIDYGYNGCSGFIPANCDRSLPSKIFYLDRRTLTAEFKPGIVVRLAPFFGSMGSPRRRSSGASAAIRLAGTPATSTIVSSLPDPRCSFPCSFEARCSRSGTATLRKGMARSTRRQSRRRSADECS
jgi:acetamidase/formamidase